MRVSIAAVGVRMPGWVQAACAEYLKRLPREWSVQIIELAQARLGKHAPPGRILRDEAERIRALINPDAHLIALDIQGQAWSTVDLSKQLQTWQLAGRDLMFMIGGPEGLEPSLLNQAGQRWSLSRLTFPHPLVRVIVLEQLYRAWSLLQNHPYHRA